MSDAIKSLFRKYNAVPARDDGPDWKGATEEALLGWYASLAPVVECGWHKALGRDATEGERAERRPLYRQIVAEITRRFEQGNPSPSLAAAYFRANYGAARVE